MVWSELPFQLRDGRQIDRGGWSKELLEDAVAEIQAGREAP